VVFGCIGIRSFVLICCVLPDSPPPSIHKPPSSQALEDCGIMFAPMFDMSFNHTFWSKPYIVFSLLAPFVACQLSTRCNTCLLPSTVSSTDLIYWSKLPVSKSYSERVINSERPSSSNVTRLTISDTFCVLSSGCGSHSRLLVVVR